MLSACAGPGYYLHAATGQWRLMHARQDIDKLIANDDTDAGLADQLRTVNAILGFAEKTLGLARGNSYRSYVETGRTAVVWNVVATPEFSLTARKWCFPVAGCVPYRGYFEKDKAERFAAKLRARDLDVSVSAATAYSTLGWFDDPLFDTMLRGGKTHLAATLFHELAHQQLYISGDTPFNEAYAGFVELTGVKIWLQSMDDQKREVSWLSQQAARADFHQLLTTTRKKLLALFQQELSDSDMRQSKSEIFHRLRLQYVELKQQRWKNHDYFSGWITADMNNARLALFQSYAGGICAFTRLFNKAGGDIRQFHRLALKRAELARSERKKWLAQSCQAIASNVDL